MGETVKSMVGLGVAGCLLIGLLACGIITAVTVTGGVVLVALVGGAAISGLTWCGLALTERLYTWALPAEPPAKLTVDITTYSIK